MRNLLREPIAESELRALFAGCPPVPLLPPLADARWQECAQKPVTQTLLAAILPRALSEKEEPLPQLTDELASEFHRSGKRMPFEKVYFERRRRLARSVFCALLAPTSSHWIPAVLRDWDDIFSEESWCLSSHVTISTGRDPFVIDLFAAETANLMGELLQLFPQAGDERRAAIRARLRDQFFLNYLDHPEKCAWISWTNNWNAVCHQGILGAALAVEDDADLLARLFHRGATHLQAFRAGFTPDGGCTEGPGYWGYGFTWFAVLNEQLETRTRGALSLFEGDPLIERVAQFGRRTLLSAHRVANFADGDAHDLPRASLLAYVGERLGDEGNRWQARTQFAALAQKAPPLDELRMDTFFLLRTVLHAPQHLEDAPDTWLKNAFLPDLSWWISHGQDSAGTRWALAAKGGHNGEHHNHNDCGSFILLLNGQPVIDEIGASEYVRDFFSAKRYGFLATRTLGHSLPIINGFEQREGEEFAARGVKAEFGPDVDEFSIDLTACYPAGARIGRFTRTFRLQREPFKLELLDEFERDVEEGNIEGALVTHGEWEQKEDGLSIRAGEEVLSVQTVGGIFVRAETPVYADKHTGAPIAISRLVFAPRTDGLLARIHWIFQAQR